MSRKMKVYTITNSADGSAGKTSARSSVLINLDQLCIPVAIRLQEIPTSGKHARSIDVSVMTGQRLKGFDQSQNIARCISLSSSQIAPIFRCVAHLLCISFPQSPEALAVSNRGHFLR